VPPPVPEGITVRPVGAEDHRAVWQLNSVVYAGTWGATPPDFDDFLEVFDHPQLCDAAWEEGQIVGFVIGRTRRGVGFIDEMTVATAHQRRGIAAALLSRNLARYPALGLPSVRLQTDAANLAGGRALYEMLGFKPLKLHRKYRRPMPQR
jgi:ribosomal protein S18 acetylase RimI-like enzyme